MPAGRNQVAYDGIGYDALTFKIDQLTIVFDPTQQGGSSAKGLAVTLAADDTVALCQDGDFVLGRLELVRDDGFATVQNEGFVQLPAGLAATITRGTFVVGATGTAGARGYVRSVNTAVAAELGKANGRIYNAADLTGVWIDLD